MILSSEYVGRCLERIRKSARLRDPLVIHPYTDDDIRTLKEDLTASVDLRLGTWFVSLRKPRMAELRSGSNAAQFSETQYVPLGDSYFLHPGSFVLGITLEWLRLPRNVAGYVIGKSSWGRRGLIIATATGVQPGFMGCLTLELTNVGEIPIQIETGSKICQIFLHKVQIERNSTAKPEDSQFSMKRKPDVGIIKADTRAAVSRLKSLAEELTDTGRELSDPKVEKAIDQMCRKLESALRETHMC